MRKFDKHEYYACYGKNYEGYNDPTYFKAVRNIELGGGREHHESRRYKLMGIIFAACNALGFEMVERVVLRDKHTGKIYK